MAHLVPEGHRAHIASEGDAEMAGKLPLPEPVHIVCVSFLEELCRTSGGDDMAARRLAQSLGLEPNAQIELRQLISAEPLQKPATPLRVGILTSARDVFGDDRVGCPLPEDSRIPGVGLEGITEFLLAETKPGGALHGWIEIVLIMEDDMPAHIHPSHRCDVNKNVSSNQPNYDFELHPERTNWLLRNDTHRGLIETARLVHQRLFSKFRGVSVKLDAVGEEQRARNTEKVEKLKQAKEAEKEAFERLMAAKAKRAGADILFSDHLMFRIQFAWRQGPFASRIFNIHPAITLLSHPHQCRGKSSTLESIERAKKDPSGISANGATFHEINGVLDDGRVIVYSDSTPVRKNDQPQESRFLNYCTKRQVTAHGLKLLACNPELREVNDRARPPEVEPAANQRMPIARHPLLDDELTAAINGVKYRLKQNPHEHQHIMGLLMGFDSPDWDVADRYRAAFVEYIMERANRGDDGWEGVLGHTCTYLQYVSFRGQLTFLLALEDLRDQMWDSVGPGKTLHEDLKTWPIAQYADMQASIARDIERELNENDILGRTHISIVTHYAQELRDRFYSERK